MQNSGERLALTSKVFNDCVHGHMELPNLCVAIIDTEIFQRLRRLKQLGFAYHVYPSAGHNRFEHSLGVCHLAGVLVDELNRSGGNECISPQEKLCLQVAGLCHDLGHGPFSHAWEHVLQKAKDEGLLEDEKDWEHEKMSIELLREIFKIPRIDSLLKKECLTENHKKLIEDLILGNEGDPNKAFLYEIISNTDTGIDVDKWDYLLRDGKQLNINVTFDPHRLLKCQRIIKVPRREGEETRWRDIICYRDKDQASIWHMYMMRAELHRMAYQHPVVRLIEEMFIDAMILVSKNYTFCGEKLFNVHKKPDIFKLLTDDIFQEILRRDEKDPNTKADNYRKAQLLLQRILNRELYHIVDKKTLSNNEEQINKEKNIIKEALKKKKQEMNSKKQSLDLYFTTVDWGMKDLQKSVYIYRKSDPATATTTEDWSSVPFYKEQVQHSEVLMFCKEEQYMKSEKEKNDLRNVASEILKKIEEEAGAEEQQSVSSKRERNDDMKKSFKRNRISVDNF